MRHWTGEPLAWELIGTYDNTEAAAGKGEHKKQYAMLPTIDHRSNEPGTDFVICAWRTNDAKHDMAADELLEFCRAVIAHSPHWLSGCPTSEPASLPVCPRMGAAVHSAASALRLRRRPASVGPPGFT